MRWRGVSHVEFAVPDYEDSIVVYDALFGWLGYSSFSSLNMEYQSIYYFTRYVNPHKLHRHSAGPCRREADAQRPSCRHQPHRAVGREQARARPLSSRILDRTGHRCG
jgi:catechol 2,3-dioxygenase-like lactoylglutathione lyase family enzyme